MSRRGPLYAGGDVTGTPPGPTTDLRAAELESDDLATELELAEFTARPCCAGRMVHELGCPNR